eukprot:5882077-Amphidinium_carterae.1
MVLGPAHHHVPVQLSESAGILNNDRREDDELVSELMEMGASDVQVTRPTAMDVDIQSRQGNVVFSSDSHGQSSQIEQEGNVGPPVIRAKWSMS